LSGFAILPPVVKGGFEAGKPYILFSRILGNASEPFECKPFDIRYPEGTVKAGRIIRDQEKTQRGF
jgi:hypothetical protein